MLCYALLALLLLPIAVNAVGDTTMFHECANQAFHPHIRAMWRQSQLNPHRSELVFELVHYQHDHMRHVTDLRFEVELDDGQVITETHTICGPSDQSLANCHRSLIDTNALDGSVPLSMPYLPSLGKPTVSVLRPVGGHAFEVVYKLCTE